MRVLATPRQAFLVLKLVGSLLLALTDVAAGYGFLAFTCLVQIIWLATTRNGPFLVLHYTGLSIYFAVAPMFQQRADVTFWGFGLIKHGYAWEAFSVLVVYILGVEVGWWNSRRSAPRPASETPPRPIRMANLCLAIAALLFALLFVNPELAFTPRGLVNERQGRVFELILFSTLPKTGLLLCFSIQAISTRFRPSWHNVTVLVAVFALAMIGASPVTTARQILIIGLLPLPLVLLSGRRPLAIAALVWAGVAGLGPIVNLVSRNAFHGVDVSHFPYSADFDAMYVAAGFLQSTGVYETGWGRYMANGWSFLLPKELKPFQSFDPLLASSMTTAFSQSNLSFPPFMTAYLDFGYLGVVLLGIAVAKVFIKVEAMLGRALWYSPSVLAGLVLLAAYIPFMRGPILGWGPFVAAGLLCSIALGGLLTWAGRMKAVGVQSRYVSYR